MQYTAHTTHSQRFAFTARAALLLFVPVVLTTSRPAQCEILCVDSTLIVISGEECLRQDESVETVCIFPNAKLKTNGFTLTVTGVGGLQCCGTLWIDEGGTVELTGGGRSGVNGSILLETASSELVIGETSAGIRGTGYVMGSHETASITIKKGLTLTSWLDIHGALTIGGAGTFENAGSVRATLHDKTITLSSSLENVLDVDEAIWKAQTFSSARLLFKHCATELVGDFALSESAKLEVATSVAVETSGSLFCTSGDIIIGTTGIFETMHDTYTASGSPYACP